MECSPPTPDGRTETSELWKDYLNLDRIRVDLPPGEQPYWTLDRSETEWRMPDDPYTGQSGDSPRLFPMRRDIERYTRGDGPGGPQVVRIIPKHGFDARNAYFSVLPQPMVMHPEVSRILEARASRMFKHYVQENSLAFREYGVPMLVGRFDTPVRKDGSIDIGELDDVCALWSRMENINPIAGSYLNAMEGQLRKPIYCAELFDKNHFIRSGMLTFSSSNDFSLPGGPSYHGQSWAETDWSYLTDDAWWRGDINDLLTQVDMIKAHGRKLEVDEVALIVRARLQDPRFQKHMDTYGESSITMAWNRDDKWPLVADNLGIMAANATIAMNFAHEYFEAFPQGRLVGKGRKGARTEATGILTPKGKKVKGESSPPQFENKLIRAGVHDQPVVLQPFKRPDTLQTAGVSFRDWDRKVILGVDHRGNWDEHRQPAKNIIPGLEDRFSMIFRTYVVYLPQEDRIVHIGGFWQATDGLIVHGGAHSVAGPLYVYGLDAHPDFETSDTLLAQRMVQGSYRLAA